MIGIFITFFLLHQFVFPAKTLEAAVWPVGLAAKRVGKPILLTRKAAQQTCLIAKQTRKAARQTCFVILPTGKATKQTCSVAKQTCFITKQTGKAALPTCLAFKQTGKTGFTTGKTAWPVKKPGQVMGFESRAGEQRTGPGVIPRLFETNTAMAQKNPETTGIERRLANGRAGVKIKKNAGQQFKAGAISKS
jgi:hypothetical protein